MSRVAIEIVDAGLVAARDGSVSPASPGVALLDPQDFAVGRDAAARARLKPVHAMDRFWSGLATTPLPRPLPQARSTSDLAFRHLAAFWAEVASEGDEAMLVVPGTMRPAEVGLLGGIAAAAGLPVEGYVDLAVAACAGLDACETVLHLDLQLHQAVVTELRGEAVLRRCRVESAPRVGLRALQSAWAQLISESMVRRTRFDPLHQAGTEQQLHDRLPGWLAGLAGSDSVEAEIDAGAGRFGVTLRREQAVLAAEAYYAQITGLIEALRRAGEPVTLALSARAAALPSLAERCASLAGDEVTLLADGAAALAATALPGADGDADPTPVLLTGLPRARVPRQPTPVPGRSQGPPPTHVVYGGRAWAIGRDALAIGLEPGPGRALVLGGRPAGVSRSHCSVVADDGTVVVRDHSRHGTWLNGVRVSGSAVLAAGDRLRLGTPGVVLELVAAG